jgi:hypothetical protein
VEIENKTKMLLLVKAVHLALTAFKTMHLPRLARAKPRNKRQKIIKCLSHNHAPCQDKCHSSEVDNPYDNQQQQTRMQHKNKKNPRPTTPSCKVIDNKRKQRWKINRQLTTAHKPNKYKRKRQRKKCSVSE